MIIIIHDCIPVHFGPAGEYILKTFTFAIIIIIRIVTYYCQWRTAPMSKNSYYSTLYNQLVSAYQARADV